MSQPVDELNFSKFGVTQVGDMDKQLTRKKIRRMNNIYPDVRSNKRVEYTSKTMIYAGSQYTDSQLELQSATRGAFFRIFYENGTASSSPQKHFFVSDVPIYMDNYVFVPDNVFIDLIDANGANYIDNVTFYGIDRNGVTVTMEDNSTNRTSADNIQFDINDDRYAFFKNKTNWSQFVCEITIVCNTGNAVEFAPPVLQGYYRDKNPIGETIDRT